MNSNSMQYADLDVTIVIIFEAILAKLEQAIG